MKINFITLISVCHAKDIETWKVASKNIAKYVEADNYLVVVPDDSIDAFKLNTDKKFNVVSENSILNIFDINKLKRTINSERYNWYLQQFIKLELLSRLVLNENAIIWDADTIPLKKIRFFDEDNAPIFYSSNEYHLPYFKLIKKLLGFDKIITKSFIAQCFPVTHNISKHLFQEIEKFNSKPWFDALLDCIDSNENSGFSEYETLGTFISHKYPHLLKWNKKFWSRYGYSVLRENNIKFKEIDKISLDHLNFDFLSFEKLELESNSYNSFNIGDYSQKKINTIFNKIKKYYNNYFAISLKNSINNIFSKHDDLLVIQIGANDGIQNDPLREYLKSPGKYKAILVEPLPFFIENLNTLYSNRNDIKIIQGAAGCEEDTKTLYYIPNEIAYNMNGDGPPNNWALGQGSFSKETVIYWIHNNSFRGKLYNENLKYWIESIDDIKVSVLPTKNYIPETTNSVFLVIDVQGFEKEVLKGLDWDLPPKYILIEEDMNNQEAREYLLNKNYSLICDHSGNLLFSNFK